jgi:hypothetical protein
LTEATANVWLRNKKGNYKTPEGVLLCRDWKCLENALAVSTGVFNWLPPTWNLAGLSLSSGSIVSDYRLDDRRSIPGRGRGFFF